MKFVSKHLLDHTRILNLRSINEEVIQWKNFFKVEYRSNLLGQTQISIFSINDQTKFYKSLYKDELQCIMCSKGKIRGKLRGNLECGSAQPSLFVLVLNKKNMVCFV